MPARYELRRKLRQQRSALPEPTRTSAARAIQRRIVNTPEYRRSRRIAAYLGVNGEIDCAELLRVAQRRGKLLFLPRVLPDGRLRFHRWTPATRMRRNRFGILEPHDPARPALPSGKLDIVFLPLVGFDLRGDRLGMGGGFYDRTFARRRRGNRAPLLIGLAYDFQRVARLGRAWWDVPLDGVVTPTHDYRFHR